MAARAGTGGAAGASGVAAGARGAFGLSAVPFSPPAWLPPALAARAPASRVPLGALPTPLAPWRGVPGVPDGCELYIKRDDLSGMQLSGNKVRKLEFLLADALARGADTVVTLGGVQSNHCRATAVAARYVGLDSHLVLRTSAAEVDADPGLSGNLLVERLVGADVELVSKREYATHGSVALGEMAAARLSAAGRAPYVVPVGGSNALGTWGYLLAAKELAEQADDAGVGVTDVVVATGSGGTAAGLALGARLAHEHANAGEGGGSGEGGGQPPRVTAYSVCDSPEYFYDYCQGLIDGMAGVGVGEGGEGDGAGAYDARELMRVVDAKGAGYAVATDEELDTVRAVARATGVVLDPVYSGKALHGLLREMASDPGAWAGRRVVFVHTGGLFGMMDEGKLAQLGPKVEAEGKVARFADFA